MKIQTTLREIERPHSQQFTKSKDESRDRYVLKLTRAARWRLLRLQTFNLHIFHLFTAPSTAMDVDFNRLWSADSSSPASSALLLHSNESANRSDGYRLKVFEQSATFVAQLQTDVSFSLFNHLICIFFYFHPQHVAALIRRLIVMQISLICMC